MAWARNRTYRLDRWATSYGRGEVFTFGIDLVVGDVIGGSPTG
jgi:hypothetical protein